MRRLPPLALVLAAVAALALSLTVAPPAGAVVDPTPNPGGSSQCQANGRVDAVVHLGGTLYLGGSFTSLNGTTRNRLAACNAATGNLLGWNPNANGVVRALAVSPAGTRIYAGGDFTNVGGAARYRVAALSPSSGAAFAWNPYVNDSVKAVTTSNSGSTVYVGGDFSSAEADGRQRLAAFSATSCAISKSFKPTVSNGAGHFATVLAMDVSPDGDSLYFSGDFALVNGKSWRNAAAVSTGIATLRAWSPASTADIAGDIILSPSGRTVFVGGRATGGYVQAYGPNTGGSPVFNVGTNGDVEALAIVPTTLYVGGHFTTVAGADRVHLAALTASGGLLSWNPEANQVFGAYDAAATSSRVAFGGEFTTVAGQNHAGVVQFTGAA